MTLLIYDCPSSYAARDRPPFSLKQFSFLERLFNKTNLEERMGAKLVTLDTLHWYCDGPEPITAACRYNAQVHQRESVALYLCFLWLFYTLTIVLLCTEMDAAKRRAHIKQQDAMQKQQGGQTSKGSGSTNPSPKRKQLEKLDRQPPKKPRVAHKLVLGLKVEGKKTITKPVHGRGKGLMTGSVPSAGVLERLSPIITVNDYKDLSNHATEAMGETGLFCIA